MTLHMDSWVWKIALVTALIIGREFVRFLSPKEVNGQTGEGARWLIETIDSAAIAIGLVLFVIQPFLLQAFYIPSGSMENTLMGPPVQNGPGGDRLLVSKMLYRLRNPRFQEVVVFRAPPAAGSPEGTDFIKRCIGVPGEVIEVRDSKVYRNGKLVAEPYAKWTQPTNGGTSFGYDTKIVNGTVYSRDYEGPGMPGNWAINGSPAPDAEQERITSASPEPVPAGQYFMLGDNRYNSNDGHAWGLVPRANVVGKAICVFWPPNRIGLVDRMSFRRRPQSDMTTALAPQQ